MYGVKRSQRVRFIATAIGFLGSGVIFSRNKAVSGVAASAGVRATVGIGMAMGCGMHLIGFASNVCDFCCAPLTKNTSQDIACEQ